MSHPVHPTQIRLNADDRLKLDVIRECLGILSLSGAIRYAISTGYYAIPEAERERLTARIEKTANQERR